MGLWGGQRGAAPDLSAIVMARRAVALPGLGGAAQGAEAL